MERRAVARAGGVHVWVRAVAVEAGVVGARGQGRESSRTIRSVEAVETEAAGHHKQQAAYSAHFSDAFHGLSYEG